MNRLGLGTIEIGREWGKHNQAVPNEKAVLSFLMHAYVQGIRYFDTAPAYGLSEERLGKFLKSLSKRQRDEITIATKMGEYWSFIFGEGRKNYSFDALKNSINRSLLLLGRVEVLQVHGVNPQVLLDYQDNILRAFEYASRVGISLLGMSISDPKALEGALSLPGVGLVQIKHNVNEPYPSKLLQKIKNRGVQIVTNRPLAEGKLGGASLEEKVEAFRFIVQTVPNAIILTGTKSPEHLDQNIEVFNQAVA